MNEDRFRHGLHVLTEDVAPSDEALHRLIGKQRSRETRRRVAGGMTGLAVITALAVVAIQIRPGGPETPPLGSGSPTPGPVGFSPEQIAYAHDGDIYVLDAKTGFREQITNDGSNVPDVHPRLQGSQQVRWISLNPDGTSSLWETDLGRRAEKTELLVTPGRINSFDSAGARLAFMVAAQEQTTVYQLDLGAPAVIEAKDGGARFALAHERWSFPPNLGRGVHYSDDTSVAWSPDGSALLVVNTFVDTATERADETLLVLDPNGNVVMEPIHGTHGRWIPGQRGQASGDALELLYQDMATKQWAVLALSIGETPTSKALVGKRNLSFPAEGTEPAISPDGTEVAMHVERSGLAPTLFVGDLATGEAIMAGVEGNPDGVEGSAPLWLLEDRLIAGDVEACPGDCMEGWRPSGSARSVEIPGGGHAPYENAIPSTIDWTARYSITTGGES